MNLDELYLKIKDASFADVVCQSEVKTDENKKLLCESGYYIPHTESQFRGRFDEIDPGRIFYSKSLSLSCFYWNRETLAICPFHVELFALGENCSVTVEEYVRAFSSCEKEVSDSHYEGVLVNLPDRMKLEYFGMLLEKYGNSVPNLYKIFFDAYREADYGFKDIDKDILAAVIASKTEADQRRTEKTVRELPDEVTIYRGGNSESTPWQKAYSWTLDVNVANFFASRRGRQAGYIVEATVNKRDIIEAFLEERGEYEIVVAPENVHVTKETVVHGMNFLKAVAQKTCPVYLQYRDKLNKLNFAQKSSVHGKEHSIRVLLFTQIISEIENLPLRERKILAEAAIYHDTMRENDDADEEHGKNARDYYVRNTDAPNYLVEFLCEYHCLPDEKGLAEIMHNKRLKRNQGLATRLLKVIKDADALDRLRLGGIRELDLNQLRLPASRGLTLISRLCLTEVKL